MIGEHTLERGVCLANSSHYFSISCFSRRSLSVLYSCSRMCRSIIFPPFFESLYWGMLIFFLSWNQLDVVHSCLTCCVGCTCCFCFSRFVHSYRRQWLAGCVSEYSVLGRIAPRWRWLVRFLRYIHIYIYIYIYIYVCMRIDTEYKGL